jgi:hypothetical protein
VKPTITKQTAHELSKYAKEINELESEIQIRKTKIIGDVREFDCRVIEIGQKLQQAKLRVGKGDWLDWLKSHVTVSERTAQIYMRISLNPQRAAGAGSIRQALTMLADSEEDPKPEKEASTLPPYLEAIGRVTKLVGYITKTRPKGSADMFAGWPDEGKAAMRRDLEPVAKELWPERF